MKKVLVVPVLVLGGCDGGAAVNPPSTPSVQPSTPSGPATPTTAPAASTPPAPTPAPTTTPPAKVTLGFKCASKESYKVVDLSTGKDYTGWVRLKQYSCNLGPCTNKSNTIKNEAKPDHQRGVCMGATEFLETLPPFDIKVWNPDGAPANAKKDANESNDCLNKSDETRAVYHRDKACGGPGGVDVIMTVEAK